MSQVRMLAMMAKESDTIVVVTLGKSFPASPAHQCRIEGKWSARLALNPRTAE
jgi:hypothetical protein